MSSSAEDHLEDQLKDRYKEFLETQDLEDNLERLEWVYRHPTGNAIKSKKEIVIEFIQDYDPTGYEDNSFRDWLKEQK